MFILEHVSRKRLKKIFFRTSKDARRVVVFDDYRRDIDL